MSNIILDNTNKGMQKENKIIFCITSAEFKNKDKLLVILG